jgi:hypothetical protein
MKSRSKGRPRRGSSSAGKRKAAPAPRRAPRARTAEGAGRTPRRRARAAGPDGAERAKASRTPARYPSAEEISARAYQRYLERGAQAGNPDEDWYAAEAELLSRGA